MPDLRVVPIRKSTCPVIAINSGRDDRNEPPPPPVSAAAKKRFFGNQYTRRSWILAFAAGSGLWRISRQHAVPPTHIEQEIREALIRSGEVERLRRAA